MCLQLACPNIFASSSKLFQINQAEVTQNIILSTVFKRYRVSNVNELGSFGIEPVQEIKAEINHAHAIKSVLDALCENYHVKIATVFNGRFTPYKTALNILQEKSIPVIIHEKGKDEILTHFCRIFL